MKVKHFILLILSVKILCNENDLKKILLTEEQNENDIKNIRKFNCTDSDIDCSGNGKCSEDGLKCECNIGFQTFYENYEDYLVNKPRCNYKSKEQIKALILSLFLSFGSAHFYLGHSLIGIIQLLFCSICHFFNLSVCYNLYCLFCQFCASL